MTTQILVPQKCDQLMQLISFISEWILLSILPRGNSMQGWWALDFRATDKVT